MRTVPHPVPAGVRPTPFTATAQPTVAGTRSTAATGSDFRRRPVGDSVPRTRPPAVTIRLPHSATHPPGRRQAQTPPTTTRWVSLLSQAQAAGWWTNGEGPSSADDFAAAGKILFDNVVWGQGIPSMPYGTLNAFNELQSWYNQAAGTTGSPSGTMGLAGGGTNFNGSAFVQLHIQIPGSGSPTQGLGILLSVTGATFNSPTGPTTVGVSTDSGGNVTIPIFAAIGGAVNVTAAASVGQVGLGFYHSGNPAAQDLVALPTPTIFSQSLGLY